MHLSIAFAPRSPARRLKELSKGLVTQAGLEKPARWLWQRRPWNRAERAWAAQLREADRLDNERMRLVLSAVLNEDSNCVDVGASEGVLFSEMVRRAPKGQHIAYEPLPSDFDQLKREFPQAIIRNAAVSDTNGTSSFAFVRNSPGWSSLHEYPVPLPDVQVQNISVETVRLDDDLPKNCVPALIKIDVNGAEREVFEGAIHTLRTHRPVVLFEHGTAAASYGTTPSMIFELLSVRCGLRIFDLDGRGPFDDASFCEAVRTKWNFVARP